MKIACVKSTSEDGRLLGLLGLQASSSSCYLGLEMTSYGRSMW